MSDKMTQPCEYSLCHCMVNASTSGANYCSDVCRDRDTNSEEMAVACECGHPPCDEE